MHKNSMHKNRQEGIFVFRRKAEHHDMADVNVYTAKRLNDMAGSLGELARAW